MYKLIIQFLLIKSCMLISLNAQSASILDPSLTIYPDPPLTTVDRISAELSGAFATSGFTIDHEPDVTILEKNIDIALFTTAPTGVVLPVITPFSVLADIGLLEQGSYNVTARFFVDNKLEHRLSESITVSAIPLPAAIWLFGSGLIGLVVASNNKRARYSVQTT